MFKRTAVLGLVLWASAFGCGGSSTSMPDLGTSAGHAGSKGEGGSTPMPGAGGSVMQGHGGSTGHAGAIAGTGGPTGAAGAAGAGAAGTGGGAACSGDPLTRCTGTMMGVWCTETVPTTAPNSFQGIWANRPDDVWLVGGDFSQGIVPDSTAMFAHFDGCTWMVTLRSDLPQLLGAWGAGPNDVWLVGSSGSAYHWNGSTLAAVAVPGATALRSVHGTSSNDVWTVGNGIFHWNGSAWAQSSASAGYDVWAVAPGDVWVASGTTDALHFNGTTWSATTLTDFGLFSIWGDGTQAYAGGEGEALFRFAGGTWTTIQGRGGSSQGFADIGGVGADVFAVGDGMLVTLSGTTFTPVVGLPYPPFFASLWVSPTQVWLNRGDGFVAWRAR